MKKITSILLAMMLLLTLSVSAMAATVTISPVDQTGADFDFYKLVSITNVPAAGTTAAYDTYAFVNAEVKAAFVTAINAYENDTNVATTDSDSAILLYITNKLNNSTFSAYLGKYLETNLAALNLTAITPTGAYDTTTQTMTYTLADNGYYLILDKSTYAGATDITRDPMLAIVNGVDTIKITLKTTTYTIPDKKIKDINGQIYDNEGNSVNIGDTVNFTITVEIPNYVQYTDSSFKVYDIMGAGYTFNSTSATATIGGVSVTAMRTRVLTGTDRAAAITAMGITVADDVTIVEFDFGKVDETFAEKIGQSLVITYSAIVNDKAAPENPNAVVVLENGTYINGNGTKTYTYGFEVEKSDEYSKLLAGVKFFLATSDDLAATGIMYLTFDDTTGVYLFDGVAAAADAPSYDATAKTWTVASTLSLVTDTNGNFKVFGLEAGTYWLYEYETLDGYNLLTAPVKIIIGSGTDAKYTYNIINYTGIELPGTGGIGTVLFPIIGGAIILGGGVLLFVNRKRVFGK